MILGFIITHNLCNPIQNVTFTQILCLSIIGECFYKLKFGGNFMKHLGIVSSLVLCLLLNIQACSKYSQKELADSSTFTLYEDNTKESTPLYNEENIYTTYYLSEQFVSLLARASSLIQNTFSLTNFYSSLDYSTFNTVYYELLFSLRFIEAVSRKKGLSFTQDEAQNLLDLLSHQTRLYLKKKNLVPDNITRFIKSFNLKEFKKILDRTSKNKDTKIYFDFYEALKNQDISFITSIRNYPKLSHLNVPSISKTLRVGALIIEGSIHLPTQISSIKCEDYIRSVLNFNIVLASSYTKEADSIVEDLTTKLLDHYSF